MKILVMPRVQMVSLFSNVDKPIGKHVAVISISSPPDDPPEYDRNIHTCRFFPLLFHDICGPIETYQEFTSEMAKQVADFGREIFADSSDIKALVCHCDAGISRSAAVAAALSKYFLGTDEQFFRKGVPNALVYKLVLEELIGCTCVSMSEVFEKQQEGHKIWKEERGRE